ncbi:c-type cytochrome [Mariprofundus ferrooxydans]|uniref:Cytochrome c n=1 Tax=Mariprofundus ferrooxydans PV-1 TaxID=314345 RepID=Q0EVW5_9PROT|nr:c-type cytochrome [Mariprofundus ferrooxydans]EAU53440.1 cytochrome c [Mariprofundus ferrooxydans PV-1]KON46423.1 cytochrome c [Mariprofundus ferrooxydans]
MYKYIGLILLVPLALSACQDNSTPPHQQAEPVQPASQTAAAVSEHQPQPESVTPSTKEGATDTVAVTKLPESNVAASVEQSMKQSQADAAATLSGLAETSKPVAADKAAVVKKQQPVAVSKPTVQETTVAPKKPVAVKKAAVVPAPVVAMGDAVKGKAKARKCAACHNFNDKKKVGPGLAGVVGRKAGTMADMKYSQALSTATWSWNEKNLALWVCNSKEAVKTLSGDPGATTKMPSQRICDAGDQANLIAYLKTL